MEYDFNGKIVDHYLYPKTLEESLVPIEIIVHDSIIAISMTQEEMFSPIYLFICKYPTMEVIYYYKHEEKSVGYIEKWAFKQSLIIITSLGTYYINLLTKEKSHMISWDPCKCNSYYCKLIGDTQCLFWMNGGLEVWDLSKENCTYKFEIRPPYREIHLLSAFYFAFIEDDCIQVYSFAYPGKLIQNIELRNHRKNETIESITIDCSVFLTKILYITGMGALGIVSCQ